MAYSLDFITDTYMLVKKINSAALVNLPKNIFLNTDYKIQRPTEMFLQKKKKTLILTPKL